jgi:hypothetical protein
MRIFYRSKPTKLYLPISQIYSIFVFNSWKKMPDLLEPLMFKYEMNGILVWNKKR